MAFGRQSPDQGNHFIEGVARRWNVPSCRVRKLAEQGDCLNNDVLSYVYMTTCWGSGVDCGPFDC